MEAKTYTKRENARRAGVAAGVPDELVEITVHKSAEGVRFGWKQMEAPAPVAADAVVTTGKPKKAAAPKVERIEQNGVKRPGPGKCLEVWDYLDQHGNMSRRTCSRSRRRRGGTSTMRRSSFTSGASSWGWEG